MIILGIESSGTKGSVALSIDGKIALSILPPTVKHSEGMLNLILGILKEHSLSLKEVEGIAFGMGPGSFTGIRIACGIAQAISFANKLPVVGINTLEAMAQSAKRLFNVEAAVTVLDARMSEVFLAAYTYKHDQWQNHIYPSLTSVNQLPILPVEHWKAVGSLPQAQQVAERLRIESNALFVEADAQSIVELSIPKFAANETLTPEQVQPFYLRNKVALTMAEQK